MAETTNGNNATSNGAATHPAAALDKRLGGLLGRLVGHPNVALVLWDGTVVHEPAREIGRIIIPDRRTLAGLFVSPEITFADAYSSGRLRVEGDLIDVLIEVSTANRRVMPRGSLRRRLINAVNRPRSTSLRRARDNIHSHYDLGNSFYEKWLDERMVYTCAYYPEPGASLPRAQVAKLDHVCRKLALKPGQTVLEAGCGWGSLALHMAEHYGVSVRAYNISREQIAYATARARAQGLEDRVTFVEDDYRNVRGSFDAFVSVGMLEHVGPKHYPTLGRCIELTLKEGGRGLIHSIGRSWPEPINPWIERNIFPGGRVPSLRQMMSIFEPDGFSVLDVENLRLHYAATCRDWLTQFEAVAAEVEAEFDADFVRKWRLYLAGSSAAFLIGNLQLFQVVFARADDNSVPWTREHMYPRDERGTAISVTLPDVRRDDPAAGDAAG